VQHLSFPTRWLRTRRDHERFLCLVEAAAFLHQKQRHHGVVEDENGRFEYIEATVADYRLAYELAREVLGSTLHELSRSAQELWEEAQRMVAARRATQQSVEFTRRDLRAHTNWPDRRLREALGELVEMEYVGANAGSQGKTYTYRLLAEVQGGPSPLRELTTPEELAQRWATAAGL
jgi:hypothetical protein